MSQALYRKWRPSRFDQVVGQGHVTNTLQNAVSAGRIGHAYLFSGPRGTGKTTIARILAKAANCLHEDLAQRPCDRCRPCIAVNEGRFLDLIEIDAASNTGVDDIRDLREKINFSPNEGRSKVYIVDEVHMLSTAAFNALLKTLEEPPSHAIFILATTEEHKVPLTIKSRCQQFNFRLLTNAEINKRLLWLAEQESLTLEPEALGVITRYGAGSLRDAESLLDQLVAVPGETVSLQRVQSILGTASSLAISSLVDAWLESDGVRGLAIIHDALNSGADARQFARQMVSYLRDLLLLHTAGRDLSLDLTEEQEASMMRQVGQATRRQLLDAVKRFDEAATTKSASWQPQLPLELAYIELLTVVPESGSVAELKREKDLDSERTGQTIEKLGNDSAKVDEKKAEPTTAILTQSHSARRKEKELKEQPPQTVEVQSPRTETLTIQWVIDNWPKLRELAGAQDRSLPALMASCKPLAMEGEVLILGFDFPLLKEKFDNKKSAQSIISDTIYELSEQRCIVKSFVTDDYMPTKVGETTSSMETKISQSKEDEAAQGPHIDRQDFTSLAQELGGVVNDQ